MMFLAANRVTIAASLYISILVSALFPISPAQAADQGSIARQWNEQLLWAIRLDSARPTVHARNLYHFSVAMWDTWAAFDVDAIGVLHNEHYVSTSPEADRQEAMSYAAYALLKWRFRRSPNVIQTNSSIERKMATLGFELPSKLNPPQGPAALGLRIAKTIIDYGLQDGSNEANDYANMHYQSINPRLAPGKPGNPNIVDANRWQPLDIPNFVGQSGERAENYPPFIGPEWGNVTPFSLVDSDAKTYQRNGQDYRVYLDPGLPPLMGTDRESQSAYKAGFEQVIEYGSRLDPKDGLIIDISPAARGNNTLGTNDGNGHPINPVSGKP